MGQTATLKENLKEYKERAEVLDTLEQEFIDSLVKLRKTRNLTQQKLADDGNVIRETIARIENRITSPQVNTLLKILEPLGYTIKLTKIKK